ncbi:MAG: hypothetical protein JST54_30870 [Deltaproteobacteria bacterium]|nr:hypothetical protein [Deltaproteobacteria bacterium]
MREIRIGAAWLALVALCACGELKLGSADGALTAPATLNFRPTVIGHPRASPLNVANQGASPHDATIVITGPFTADSNVHLAGGASTPITVSFNPTTAGDATGTFTLTADGQTLTVALSGIGLTPTHCATPGACHTVTFDPESNTCVDGTLDDGASCSAGTCIANGQCRSGQCLGEVRSCDDGNACTADACDATQGCVHVDISSNCPAPTAPCKVATCDPGSGCGVTDAPDGTPCGSANCDTAHVCLMGSCQEVSVPEGAPCAAATPCQQGGTCHSHTCVQPAQGELTPAWTYSPTTGDSLTFPGTLDDSEDLYWVECHATTDGGCDLVSTTHEGYFRYRQPLDGYFYGQPWGASSGVIASRGHLVITLSDGRVQLRAQRDGALLWEEQLVTRLLPPPDDGGPSATGSVTGMAEVDADTLAVRFTLDDPATSQSIAALAMLDVDGGDLRGAVTLFGTGSGLIVDGFGKTWMAGTFELPDSGWVQQVIGLDRTGTIVEVRDSPGYTAGSIVDGALTLSSYDTTYLAWPDGGTTPIGPGATTGDWYGGMGSAPVGDANIGYLVGGTYACRGDFAGPCGGPLLVAFVPSTGDVLWDTGDAGWSYEGATQPMLTDRDNVLLATGNYPVYEDAEAAQLPPFDALVSYDAAGDQLYACAFPDAGYTSWLGGSALGTNRWYVARMVSGVPTLEAYDVPDTASATHGWVTLGGTPGQTGQAR